MANHRTSDGYLTVVALKAGGVDQQAWIAGHTAHVTTLKMIRPHPNALFEVKHIQVSTPDAEPQFEHTDVELFSDVRLARNRFRKLRSTPPKRPATGQTGKP